MWPARGSCKCIGSLLLRKSNIECEGQEISSIYLCQNPGRHDNSRVSNGSSVFPILPFAPRRGLLTGREARRNASNAYSHEVRARRNIRQYREER